jgi:hypothetical protein
VETTLPKTSDANCATIVEIEFLGVPAVESADPAAIAGVLLCEFPGELIHRSTFGATEFPPARFVYDCGAHNPTAKPTFSMG